MATSSKPVSKPVSKLSTDDFIVKAIRTLREQSNAKAREKGKPESRGIHVVFDGFNAAFAAYYGHPMPVKGAPCQQAIDAVESAVERGVIERRWAFKGARLFLAGEAPAERETSEARAANTLRAMGL